MLFCCSCERMIVGQFENMLTPSIANAARASLSVVTSEGAHG